MMLDDAELDADMADAERMIATGGHVAYETVRGLLRTVRAARQQLAAFKPTAENLNAEGVDSSSVAALPVQDAGTDELLYDRSPEAIEAYPLDGSDPDTVIALREAFDAGRQSATSGPDWRKITEDRSWQSQAWEAAFAANEQPPVAVQDADLREKIAAAFIDGYHETPGFFDMLTDHAPGEGPRTNSLRGADAVLAVLRPAQDEATGESEL